MTTQLLVIYLKAGISDPRLWKGLAAFSVLIFFFYLITRAEKGINGGSESTPDNRGKELLYFYVAIDKHTDKFIIAKVRDFKNQSVSKKIEMEVSKETADKFNNDYHFRQCLIPVGKRFSNLDHCANYVKVILSK
jgi:hypothetical protein